ncbi:Hypothetical protein SMAX5B_005637 [Scophthalmus maximus]|uniref:Uncharacterized protein n=1 Tax=Scophthalmus maximus TaxID=52904 RepID=A0A2U9BBG2_SCOMX|nr:Hypothetical protein SMAX5B_005637 [Scophthalmus maximus]
MANSRRSDRSRSHVADNCGGPERGRTSSDGVPIDSLMRPLVPFIKEHYSCCTADRSAGEAPASRFASSDVRSRAFGCRSIRFDITVLPGKLGGCCSVQSAGSSARPNDDVTDLPKHKCQPRYSCRGREGARRVQSLSESGERGEIEFEGNCDDDAEHPNSNNQI